MGFPRIGFVGLLLVALAASAASAQSLPGIPMGVVTPGGKSTASLDGTYLRLDTSNDPLTGVLAVKAGTSTAAPSLTTPDNSSVLWISAGDGAQGRGISINPVAASSTDAGVTIFGSAAAASNRSSVLVSTTVVTSASDRYPLRIQANGSVDVWKVAGNGQTYHSDGTASAPTITFSAETNTGLFRGAAGALSITTAGTERMTFSSAGIIPKTTATYALGSASFVWTTLFAKTIAGRGADAAPLLFADDSGYQFTDDGATNTWFAIGATGNLTGFQAATGTSRYIKLPGEVAATITKPTCNSAIPGAVMYLDDSNDADSSHVCVCAADSAGVFSWEDITFLKPCDL